MIDMPAGGVGDIPFASMGDLGLDRRKVTQCALSRICGVCGESLARPVAFLGSVEEADRNAFHFPPSHIECADTALELWSKDSSAALGYPVPAGGVGSGDHLGVRVHPAHAGHRGRAFGVLAELRDRRQAAATGVSRPLDWPACLLQQPK